MDSAVSARVRRLPQLVADNRLAEVCLLLGTFVEPDLDAVSYLGRLDRMAAAVEGRTHLSLRRVISIQEGIGGNTDDYDAHRQRLISIGFSTLGEVWPIIVSVIWIEVGRRAGIDVQGVALPGHFLVFAGGQLVDPFHFGEAIGRDEAAVLVAESIGGPPRLEPTWLNAVDTATIVQRILNNLYSRYEKLDRPDRPRVGSRLRRDPCLRRL